MAMGVLWHRSHGFGGDNIGPGAHRLGTSGSNKRGQSSIRLDWRSTVYRSLDRVPQRDDLGSVSRIRSPVSHPRARRVGGATGSVRGAGNAQLFPDDGHPAVQAAPLCVWRPRKLPEFPWHAVGSIPDAVLPPGGTRSLSGPGGSADCTRRCRDDCHGPAKWTTIRSVRVALVHHGRTADFDSRATNTIDSQARYAFRLRNGRDDTSKYGHRNVQRSKQLLGAQRGRAEQVRSHLRLPEPRPQLRKPVQHSDSDCNRDCYHGVNGL